MAERIPRDEYPWWVKLSLWGVPGRVGLWAYVALSVGLTVACVAYGFVDRRSFLGGLFVFSALIYWLSIRWIDRHGSWESDSKLGVENLAKDE
jgi:hypothetical protein